MALIISTCFTGHPHPAFPAATFYCLHAVADGIWHILTGEKTLEFLLVVLPAEPRLTGTLPLNKV